MKRTFNLLILILECIYITLKIFSVFSHLFYILLTKVYYSSTKYKIDLRHPLSSDRSPQSSWRLHTLVKGTHLGPRHLNSELEHVRGGFLHNVWLFSSDPSPQSSWLLHTCQIGMQRWLLHWNLWLESHENSPGIFWAIKQD